MIFLLFKTERGSLDQSTKESASLAVRTIIGTLFIESGPPATRYVHSTTGGGLGVPVPVLTRAVLARGQARRHARGRARARDRGRG